MISLKRLAYSFRYAGEGFHYAFRNEQNLLIHVIISFFVVGLGLYFQINRFELITLAIMILLVLVAEMVNTSIEKVVDLITMDHHPSAKIAKDVSAAMVLLTALGACVVGVIIFLPYVSGLLIFPDR